MCSCWLLWKQPLRQNVLETSLYERKGEEAGWDRGGSGIAMQARPSLSRLGGEMILLGVVLGRAAQVRFKG